MSISQIAEQTGIEKERVFRLLKRVIKVNTGAGEIIAETELFIRGINTLDAFDVLISEYKAF